MLNVVWAATIVLVEVHCIRSVRDTFRAQCLWCSLNCDVHWRQRFAFLYRLRCQSSLHCVFCCNWYCWFSDGVSQWFRFRGIGLRHLERTRQWRIMAASVTNPASCRSSVGIFVTLSVAMYDVNFMANIFHAFLYQSQKAHQRPDVHSLFSTLFVAMIAIYAAVNMREEKRWCQAIKPN